MNKMEQFGRIAFYIILLFISGCTGSVRDRHELFVPLSIYDNTIQQDIRYHGSDNFMGRPVAGYLRPVCLLTKHAAQAMVAAQQLAMSNGYALKVYDCYRPQRAVNDFVAWSRDTHDVKMQHRFYPRVPKQELFARGYIAEQSGHSRGSTVDLTLVPVHFRPIQPGITSTEYDCRTGSGDRNFDNSIDMGTAFDCFDALAHTDSADISTHARQNRRLLKSIMEGAGFVNYDKEWWHYTLKDEPFPDTYFNFTVE